MINNDQAFRHLMYRKYPYLTFRKIPNTHKFYVSGPLDDEDAKQLKMHRDETGNLLVELTITTNPRTPLRYDACPTSYVSYLAWIMRNNTIREQKKHFHGFESAHNLLLRDEALSRPNRYSLNTDISEETWRKQRGYTVVELCNVEDAAQILSNVPWVYDSETLTYVIAVKNTTYVSRHQVAAQKVINDDTKLMQFYKALFTGTESDVREAVTWFAGPNTYPNTRDGQQIQIEEKIAERGLLPTLMLYASQDEGDFE